MIAWEKDDSGLSLRDIEKRQPFKLEPHVFKAMKRLSWMRCQRCGLLNLRNDFSAWATKMGCNNADHPEYAARCKSSRPRTAS